MFTGLIDDVGTIERVARTDAGREFTIRCRYDDLVAGESIAVSGACLTVREFGPHWFTAAAIITTLGRTTMAHWDAGMRVNLERSLRLGDRLGGHMVQGHVDGVGTVVSTRMAGDACLIDIEVPSELFDVLVPHGSVTIDGVSLTVNELPRERILQISLIEYTLRHTTLGDLQPGSQVHVENDVIGKYVQRLVAPYVEA
jgi:riboflavin synthase